MKRVAIFTTTRAEFGILSPLIQEMEKSDDIEPLIFVGGTHITWEHGRTINEIEASGFEISDTFDYLLNRDDSVSLGKSVGIASYELAHIFNKHDFDMVCVLGDRFELLSIVGNAILFKKPILHISGGEKTEGLIDEQIRHMVTKAAHLHCVSCDEYAQNIRLMGEAPWRIHNTGALNIDSIVNSERLPRTQLFKKLGIDKDKPSVLLTYHPVTLEFEVSPEQQISNIFEAIRPYGYQLVITSPNIDTDREKILSLIKEEVNGNPEMFFFDSLGSKTYHNLIPECEFVIGNSSSGLTEVPFFRLPTLNVGDRQNGRIRHKSVIDTDYSVDHIKKGIEMTMSKDFRKSLKEMRFKFGDGHAAEKMVDIISKVSIDQKLMRKKLYYS